MTTLEKVSIELQGIEWKIKAANTRIENCKESLRASLEPNINPSEIKHYANIIFEEHENLRQLEETKRMLENIAK